MNSIEAQLGLNKKDVMELLETTGAPNPLVAVERAVRFTLLHDKDSVQGALK